jgi:nitrite reductase/ring-hydroxylating ferredoxin subunit
METMIEHDWEVLNGLHPETSKFPARAKVGGESILIFKLPNGFRGVQRACPHQKASLMDAMVMANGTMLRCALHAFTFRLSDGKGVNCPGFRLKLYEVKEQDGILLAKPNQ